MIHQEKQRIFDAYAKSQGFKDWEAIQFQYCTLSMTDDEFNLYMFTACDLVQEQQQKRIADNARMNFHDGHNKFNCPLKHFQAGADNLTVDKSSILNPENLIK